MKDSLRILVSSIPFRSQQIGSWTNRMRTFIDGNPDFFDVILSPDLTEGKFQQCRKGKFTTYHTKLRTTILLNVVAKDYLKAIKKFSEKAEKITVVVMDDPHLLEAIAKTKATFYADTELVYSYHGFKSPMDHKLLQKVDKMLFLTRKGYLATKNDKFSFTPEVFVVGNGVDSNVFFPADDNERREKRAALGLQSEDIAIVWMANERPIKGFTLFRKIAKHLKERHANLKFIVIGTEEKTEEQGMQFLGQQQNDQLPQYLQAGDIYLFTSLCREGFGLSMIEALKCGNRVVAADNGGIPEVLEGLPNCHIIKYPNVLEDWLQSLNEIIRDYKYQAIGKEEANSIWSYTDWENRFKHAIES